MFGKRSTKWIVLATYNESGNDYAVLCRKNKKTGMLYFRTKMVGKYFGCSYLFSGNIVDINTQFNKIIEL